MVTMGVFLFQGKTHMVEPGIEPGTSWLVVRNSDHQATRVVGDDNIETDLLCVGFGDDIFKSYKWLQVLRKTNAF